MSRRSIPKPQVTVALAVGDAGLGQRLAEAIAAQPELAIDDRVDAADIVIVAAAELGAIGRHRSAIICLGDGSAAEAVGGALRALLPADADAQLIVGAARLVARGLLVLPEAALDPGPAPEPGEDEEPPAEEHVPLTPREGEVLELLAAGASNKIIARRLGVSVHTAKFHVASLLRKLGASGRLEAVGIGLRTGRVML
jgi:DNA-binding NarL/FixJ family response regulator